MFEESIPFLAVIVAAIVGSAAVVFGYDFMRNQQSKNQRKDELDAINHAQAVQVLGNISAQSAADNTDVVQQDLADNVKSAPSGGAKST